MRQTCGSAATPPARVALVTELAAIASAKIAGSFFGRAARVRDRDDPVDPRGPSGVEARTTACAFSIVSARSVV